MLSALLLAPVFFAPFQEDEAQAPRGRALVFRVDRIETLDGEALENAVVLVREGIIEKMGRAVVIPDRAVVHDLRGRGSVLMPPLVLGHAGFLVDDSRGFGRNSRHTAADSLWLDEDTLEDLRAEGVLLAGVDPPGSGIPGRTSVISSVSESPRPEPVIGDLHLKVTLDASTRGKDAVRDAFKNAEEAIQKESDARTAWEKARKEWEEKEKKAEDAKKDGEDKKKEEGKKAAEGKPETGKKGKGEEEKAPPEEFTPPKIGADLEPIVEWVQGKRVAEIWLDSAAEWLHWREVIGDREHARGIVFRHGQTTNLFEIADGVAEAGVRVDLPARMSFLPYTRLRCNLPAEFLAAGVENLTLSPASDSLIGVREWRAQLAHLVAEGLDRSAALKAVTVGPAASLGVEDRVAPLVPGGKANFMVLDGDPLDPVSQVRFLVADGEVVWDRSKEEGE